MLLQIPTKIFDVTILGLVNPSQFGFLGRHWSRQPKGSGRDSCSPFYMVRRANDGRETEVS